MQNIALGEGSYRIGRHQANQDLHQRGCLLGFLHTAGDHVHAFAWRKQGAEQQANAHRKCGSDQVDGDGFNADAAELGAVTHGGNTGHQRNKHQRHDKHLDRIEKQRANGREHQCVGLEQHAGKYAEAKANQDLLPQRHAPQEA